MGGCQNHGPLLGPLNTRCRNIIRTQKGTIILTTTHVRSQKTESFVTKGCRYHHSPAQRRDIMTPSRPRQQLSGGSYVVVSVMTCFFLGIVNKQPKKELHRSLQVWSYLLGAFGFCSTRNPGSRGQLQWEAFLRHLWRHFIRLR